MKIKESIVVNRPPEEVYAFWQDFRNLPGFIQEIESVQKTGENKLRLKSKQPDGKTSEFDVDITAVIPFSLISWKVEGESEGQLGMARFERATGGRGTLVRVDMEMDLAAADEVKAKIADLFADNPSHSVNKAMRAAKQIIETGGITISDAMFSPDHPAQPPSDSELPLFREYGRKFHGAEKQVRKEIPDES